MIIKLAKLNISGYARSEARKILADIGDKKIILDFDKIPMLGQAFADEIFRVYKIKHPDIEIVSINMNDAVKFMIGRVGKPGKMGEK
ncbi:MAG TPA: STAS-like domain-containing protein [Patescibacteria group bacterium]